VSGKYWKEKIEDIPFIFYNKNSTTRSYVDQAFGKIGVKPKILVESTSPIFMKELAMGKCGIALLPRNFVMREIKTKKLFTHKLPCSFKRGIGIFINKDGNLKESDQILLEIISNLTSQS